MAQCPNVTAPYMDPFPQFVPYLVVSKSFYSGSYFIVGCDGVRLVHINMPNEYKDEIGVENFYEFQLDKQALIKAYTVTVQGRPKHLRFNQAGMFSALKNLSSEAAFNEMYMSVPGQTFITVEYAAQPPKALIVKGDMIVKSIMPEGPTRCVIISGGLHYDMRYMGTHADNYDQLPKHFMHNLAEYSYTLILIVADPLYGNWQGTRNYILVAAVYKN